MQDMKLLHILVALLCYISDRMFNSLLSTNCFDELCFCICFCNVVYTSDIMSNYLKSTSCFDELFLAFDFNFVNRTDRISNSLNDTTMH